MKFQLSIRIEGIALTLLLVYAAQGQANDLVCTQCVNTSDVADNAITSPKLKTDSVTSAKIGAGEVKTGDIADFSITTSKLKSDSVSSAKLQAGSVTQSKLDPTVLAALHVKFASVSAYGFTDLIAGGGCQNDPSFTVRIEVPGPGLVKVDAQVTLVKEGHTNGIQETMYVYLGAAPDDCNGEGWGLWFIRYGEPGWEEPVYQTVPVGRTFTVSGAGTYTYYLNGVRSYNEVTSGGIYYANVQALYFPDL